jgi:hypothetical protein
MNLIESRILKRKRRELMDDDEICNTSGLRALFILSYCLHSHLSRTLVPQECKQNRHLLRIDAVCVVGGFMKISTFDSA